MRMSDFPDDDTESEVRWHCVGMADQARSCLGLGFGRKRVEGLEKGLGFSRKWFRVSWDQGRFREHSLRASYAPRISLACWTCLMRGPCEQATQKNVTFSPAGRLLLSRCVSLGLKVWGLRFRV